MQDKPRWCDCFGYFCYRSFCVDKLLKARAERNRQGGHGTTPPGPRVTRRRKRRATYPMATWVHVLIEAPDGTMAHEPLNPLPA